MTKPLKASAKNGEKKVNDDKRIAATHYPLGQSNDQSPTNSNNDIKHFGKCFNGKTIDVYNRTNTRGKRH